MLADGRRPEEAEIGGRGRGLASVGAVSAGVCLSAPNMRRARLVLTAATAPRFPQLEPCPRWRLRSAPPPCLVCVAPSVPPTPTITDAHLLFCETARRRTPPSPSKYVSHHRSVLHTRYVHAGGRSEQEQNTATDPSYGALQQQRRSELAS